MSEILLNLLYLNRDEVVMESGAGTILKYR